MCFYWDRPLIILNTCKHGRSSVVHIPLLHASGQTQKRHERSRHMLVYCSPSNATALPVANNLSGDLLAPFFIYKNCAASVKSEKLFSYANNLPTLKIITSISCPPRVIAQSHKENLPLSNKLKIAGFGNTDQS